MKKINSLLILAAFSMMAVSCDKNDNPSDPKTTGDNISIDASSYTSWTYLDFETGKTETHESFDDCYYTGDASTVAGTGDESTDVTIDWDIAFHRYEVRTNGGSAIKTSYTSIDDVVDVPTSGYTADKIITYDDYADGYYIIMDMSGMMTGSIGYATNAAYNTLLSAVVERTGSMGSYVYTPSDYVYVIQSVDGGVTKVKWTAATNSTGDTGHVTVEYEHTYTE
ncbi:MAG: HmuY family protein [Rikenellaceae bacterium]